MKYCHAHDTSYIDDCPRCAGREGLPYKTVEDRAVIYSLLVNIIAEGHEFIFSAYLQTVINVKSADVVNGFFPELALTAPPHVREIELTYGLSWIHWFTTLPEGMQQRRRCLLEALVHCTEAVQ